MRIHHILMIFLCAILLSVSCTENSATSSKINLVDHATDVIDSTAILIPDSVVHPFSMAAFNWNHGPDFLSYLSERGDDSLMLYRFNARTGVWKCNYLRKNGRNQVYSYGNYSHYNDQIAFFPRTKKSVIFLDSLGNKLNEYLFSKDFMISAYNRYESTNIFYDDLSQNLYFGITEYKELTDSEGYASNYLVGIFNTNELKLKKIIPFPEEFHNKIWTVKQVKRDYYFSDKHIYVSFEKSQYVYKYDLEGNPISKALISSKNVRNAVPAVGGLSSQDEALIHERNGYYSSLIYDSYRDIFYRIANFYSDVNEEFTSIYDLVRYRDSKTMEIIVFTKDLEIIGRNKYSFSDFGLVDDLFFITEQGLHIRTIKNTKEEQIKFFTIGL